jgi:DNA-binding winged helix-turn-helix (wHTH) protein
MPVLLLTPDTNRTVLQNPGLVSLSTGHGLSLPTAIEEFRASGLVIVGVKNPDPMELVCELRRQPGLRGATIPIAIIRSIDELPAVLRSDQKRLRGRSIFGPLSRLKRLASRSGTRGKFIIDQRGREIVIEGNRRIWSPQEFRLLLFFLRFPSILFSRAELVWRISRNNRSVDSRLIDVLVSRIRRKIQVRGSAAGRLWTVRTLGYGFTYNEKCFVDAITGSSFVAWPGLSAGGSENRSGGSPERHQEAGDE